MWTGFKDVLVVLAITAFLVTTGVSASANGKVTILKPDKELVTIMQPKLYSLQGVDQDKVKDAVKNTFSLGAKRTKYSEAKVKVIYENYNQDNQPIGNFYLVAYLCRKGSYLFETNKIELNEDYTVKQVYKNYTEQEQDYAPYG